MDIDLPGDGMRFPLDVASARAPSIPRRLGYPGLGGDPPHLCTHGWPGRAAPGVPPMPALAGSRAASPPTPGRTQGLQSPKIPPKQPGPGCQVPPAASRARGWGCSLLRRLCCLGTARVLTPQTPQPLQRGAELAAGSAQTGDCPSLEQMQGPRILAAPMASAFSSAETQKKEGKVEDGCSEHPQPGRPPPGHKSPFEDRFYSGPARISISKASRGVVGAAVKSSN